MSRAGTIGNTTVAFLLSVGTGLADAPAIPKPKPLPPKTQNFSGDFMESCRNVRGDFTQESTSAWPCQKKIAIDNNTTILTDMFSNGFRPETFHAQTYCQVAAAMAGTNYDDGTLVDSNIKCSNALSSTANTPEKIEKRQDIDDILACAQRDQSACNRLNEPDITNL